jgi:hypothetical protein
MPRSCIICSDSRKLAKAAELIASGHSDQAVANALNALTPDQPPMSLMAVSRHRRAHLLAPAKALADAASKGREVTEQRAQMLAAAEAGDPSAFVALQGIVDDLRKVHERLERTAEAAEHDNQRLAVASLSAQQLRAAEVRAKIGGVGAFAAKATGDGQPAMVNFQINFTGGKTEQFGVVSAVAEKTDEVPPQPRGIRWPSIKSADPIAALPESEGDEEGVFDDDA